MIKYSVKKPFTVFVAVIIVLVILRTTVTGQDSIKFIDDTDDQPIDQQNSDSIDLRYSNEYQSWKQLSAVCLMGTNKLISWPNIPE